MSYKIAMELLAIREKYEQRLRQIRDEHEGAESAVMIYVAGSKAIEQAMERLRNKGLIPDGELWETPDHEQWFGVDGESIFTRVRDGYARRRAYIEQDYGLLVKVRPLPVDLD